MSRRWGDRDHIKIPSEFIIRGRKPNPKFKIKHKPDPENFAEKGNALYNQLEDTVKDAHRDKPVAGENVFIVLTTTKPISKEHVVLGKYFTFSLQTAERSAIVSINEPKLQEIRSDLKKYAQSEEQKTYISQIQQIARVRITKLSPELRNWMAEEHSDYEQIEIDLLPNMGENYYGEIISKMQVFLESTDSPIIDSFYDENVASIRTQLKPNTLYSMVQGIDSIWQARKAPESLFGEPQGVALKEMPKIERSLEALSPICVLDTGVDATHPLMGKGVLTQSYDFTPDHEVSDFNGHGTFVAGLASYFDLENLENRKSIVPSASVISAKIQSRQKRLNKKFLEKRITTAVEVIHSTTNIFSLSIMYPNHCDYSKRPSKLAHTIDKLSSKYNVLFIISSGNLDEQEIQPLNRRSSYPQYFADKRCITYHGAESCNCLTVGGIAHKVNSNSIARKGQPSPFTRRGEFSCRYKPDLVHFAGNLEIDPLTRVVGANKPELGVASLGINPHQIAYDLGTSYSAPMVANILARLKKVHPEASLNLLKALLIHSASWPDTHSLLNVSKEMKKVLYGKGMPSFEKAAYCENHSPAYIVQDSLRCDETARIPFFVPAIMKEIWDRQIRITLVYDPPVNVGVEGYTLVDLDFKLYKQLEDDSLVEQGQGTRWTNDYRLPWDNVKSDVYKWQQSGWGKEWQLEIIPDVRFRNEFDGVRHVQEYAVVISIENPGIRHNIYEAIEKGRRKVPQAIEIKPTKQQILIPHQ